MLSLARDSRSYALVEVAENLQKPEIYRLDNIWHAKRINEVSEMFSTRAKRKNFPYLKRWFESFHFLPRN